MICLILLPADQAGDDAVAALLRMFKHDEEGHRASFQKMLDSLTRTAGATPPQRRKAAWHVFPMDA